MAEITEDPVILKEPEPQEDSQVSQATQATEVVEGQPPLPADQFASLQAHLQDYPYDTNAWQDFVNLAEDSGDSTKISLAYDSLLKVYPNTVQVQIAYLRHSLRIYPPGKPKTSDTDTMPTPQSLFSQWLKQSPEVELWKLYLDYVRGNQASPREVIKKAYEFALRFIGQDREAGEIWKDYLEYIKADPTSNERESQEKMDLLRSVYRRAVQIPLDNLEQLWREWDAFENGLNKLTAKKFLADVSPDYMTARTKKTELAEHHKRIKLSNKPLYGSDQRQPLDLPSPPVLRSEERSLLASWRKYLEFEESNPLDIDEKAMLNARILSIYRKAVIRMRFYPEVWHLAYLWSQTASKKEEAHSFLENGLKANPTSFLLNFSYCEYQEQAFTAPNVDPKEVEEKKAGGHKLFKDFTSLLRKELDDLEAIHIASGGIPVSQQPASAVTGNANPNANSNNAAAVLKDLKDDEDDIAMKENEIYGTIDPSVEQAKERERERQRENERREARLIDKRIELGLACIAWMRYARRVGGTAGMRNVFKEVRADKWVSWQVFEAAALLEHQISPAADVAAKIFELGMRLFFNDVDYVVRYLNFLINKCDEANARALFERSVSSLESEKARPIWQRWLQYQMGVADLATLHKLDKRVADAYPSDRTMKLFAQRYTYLGNEICAPTFGIDAIASHDLQTPIRIPSVIMPPSLVPAPTPLVPHDSPSYPNGGYGQPYTPQGPYSAQAQGYTPQNYQQQGYAYGGGAGPGAGQNAPGGNFGTGGPGVAGPTGGVGVGAGGLGVNTNTAGILRPAPRVASPTTAPKRPLPDVDRMDGGAGSVTKKVRRSPPPGPHGPRRGMHQHPPGGGHSGPGSRRASPPPHSQSMPSMSHSGPGRGPAGGGMGMNPGGYGGPERRGRGRSPERANVPQSIIWMLSKLPTAAAYDGPKFKVDEYINMLKRLNIPHGGSGGPIRSRSPPSRGTRGPPDYGPYTGPGPRPRRY